MSDLKTLQTELAAKEADLASKEKAITLMTDMAKQQKKDKDPGTVEAIATFTAIRDAVQGEIDKIKSQMASLERSERTKTIVEPLIEKFGTFTLPADAGDASEFRVEFVNVANDIKAQRDVIRAANTKIATLEHLAKTVLDLKISDEVAADLKAVRFVVASPKSYTLALAKAGGTRAGGGTRSGNKNEIYTITKANETHADLVGSKIGKNQDFESWRDLIAKADPALFDELEKRKAGTWPGSEGKKSNWSGSVIASRKLGIEWSTEVVAEAPETPAAEPAAA